MKVIFILAFIATLFAVTSAYYPGGLPPSKDLLGHTRGELRDWIIEEEEEEQRLKIKGLLKEIGRKVVIPKVVDKLQALDEEEEEEQRLKIKDFLKEVGRKVIVPKIIDKLQTLEEDEPELQKLKIGKIIRTVVLPRIIAALDESAEDGSSEELVGGHFHEHPRGQLRERVRVRFPKWRKHTPAV